MPFNIVFPLTKLPDSAPPPMPRSGASLPRELTSNSAPRCHALRLDEVPAEIVLRIVQYLHSTDALALSATSGRLLRALRADVVDPLRLAERIRWVSSLSGFEVALSAIDGMRKGAQRALFHRLGERLAVLPEPLRQPARNALQARLRYPEPPSAGIRMAPAYLESTQLFDASNKDIRNASAPQPGQEALAMMAAALPDGGAVSDKDEYDQGMQIILAALEASAGADGGVPASHAGVLATLAHRLRGAPTAACGRYWDAVFSLARRLPPHARRRVMATLTEMFQTEDDFPEIDCATALNPRWRRLIDHVCAAYEPEHIAHLLGRLAQHSCEAVGGFPDDRVIPLTHALWEAARALPDAPWAKLAADILRWRPANKPVNLSLWDSAFEASASVAISVAAPVYDALADAIHDLPAGDDAIRWDALCQRLGRFACADLALVEGAVQHLAEVGFARRSPERRAMLMRLGTRLPAETRGSLCEAMSLADYISPALWRAQVTELADLPHRVRHGTATLLGDKLFRYGTRAGVFTHTDPTCQPDPGGLAAAEFPGSLSDALNKLSDILSLLPLAHRGEMLLLLSLSLSQMPGHLRNDPMPWSATRISWLLREAMRLAPLHHHGIGVVTHIALVAERQCPTEADARTIFPALQQAVSVLPAEARASGLFYLGLLVGRLLPGVPGLLPSINAQLSALPDADVRALRTRSSSAQWQPPGT